jgi:Tol biopolymer transport system component
MQPALADTSRREAGHSVEQLIEGSRENMKRPGVWPTVAFAFAVIGAAAVVADLVVAHPGTTQRVSVASSGGEGNHNSSSASMSGDGRFIAFESSATNLVADDTNGAVDVFVHDRDTGTTARVSVATDGTEGNVGSYRPSMSADGRYVAFSSPASNLVDGDENALFDVFVHDRESRTTTRISVAGDGAEGNASSFKPSISMDGRFVAFYSGASNLVAGDTNGTHDVFVHDRESGATTRVSVGTGGTQASENSVDPSLSGDGRFVAFQSDAPNLVIGDSNMAHDIFVHDRLSGVTARISVADDGTEGGLGLASLAPSVSADGRFVAFYSAAPNFVAGDTNGVADIFVHDRQTGSKVRVSVATGGSESNHYSFTPSLSSDGRFTAFWSDASNLVAGDTNAAADVFVHDRESATTVRASVSGLEAESNGPSFFPNISADGRFVAYHSFASNLVAQDTNEEVDVFVHDLHELHDPNDTPFTDIEGNPFEHDIVWLYHEAITRGCNPEGTLFCPTMTVSREQMASFLVRAHGLPPATQDYFVDDEHSVHQGDINSLREAGITTGCGTDRVPGSPTFGRPIFCPSQLVSRQEMASFLARALTLPDPSGDYFDDDESSVHENDINKMAEAAITLGCGGRSYCPAQAVPRQQMAAFLHRAAD